MYNSSLLSHRERCNGMITLSNFKTNAGTQTKITRRKAVKIEFDIKSYYTEETCKKIITKIFYEGKSVIQEQLCEILGISRNQFFRRFKNAKKGSVNGKEFYIQKKINDRFLIYKGLDLYKSYENIDGICKFFHVSDSAIYNRVSSKMIDKDGFMVKIKRRLLK
ncbi:MAG: hypothetical protein WBA93_30970 [Microcoleaceae cyanobacterium]